MTAPRRFAGRATSDRGLALALLAASFLVRAAVLAALSPIPTYYDEKAYYSRAVGFSEIYGQLWRGESPQDGSLYDAYAEGLWPPFHPALLGAALFGLGAERGVARWTVALLSALTTPLVFRLTRRLADRRAAVAAGALHAVYPSFVAYGHLVYSESTYILALLLALHWALRIPDAPAVARRLRDAALCGAALGVCALTRVAALPALAVVPAWLLFVGRREQRIAAAATVAAVALVTISPWALTMRQLEGRFMLLTTASGYNLLKENSDLPSDNEVFRAILRYVGEHGGHQDAAGRALALAEIRADPTRFLERCGVRLRKLWNMDGFALRQLLHAVYPPISAPAWYAVCALLLAGYLALVALACRGFLLGGIAARDRALLAALLLAGMAAPLVSVSNSRMGLPLLALLLPLAGAGTARAPRARAANLAAAALVLVNAASIVTLPREHFGSNYASSHYRDVVIPVGALGANRTPTSDCLQLRADAPQGRDRVTTRIASPGYRFHDNRDVRTERTLVGTRARKLLVYAHEPRGPLRIELASERLGRSVELSPIRRDFWRRWQPTGLEGIELHWCGVGSPPPRRSGPR